MNIGSHLIRDYIGYNYETEKFLVSFRNQYVGKARNDKLLVG